MSGETEELTLGAREGDGGAYEALFARVADRLLLYVRLRLGPRLAGSLEPMDVVQDTYLAALRAFGGFEPREPGAFSRWLFRIADNRLRDAAEHLGAQKRQALEGAVRSSTVLTRLRAEEASPQTETQRREQARALHEALAGIDEDERRAVLLRHFHDATFAGIGEELGVSEATARRLVVRAHARLGEALRGLSS
ncbi:MAG: RNA polymerase sigma factor [Planctomycetota bacterium]